MRIYFWIITLASLQLIQAGEIARYYWQTTNHVDTSKPFAGPKRVGTSHGISEIGIERDGCFGSCPVYECIIRSDGSVRYHGEAYVDKIADWVGTVDQEKFHQLANFIAESGYWQMQDTFSSSVTDASTVYTTFVLRGHRKVFRNYASSGPPKLWALQQLIDGLLAGATWQRAVTARTASGTNGGASLLSKLDEKAQRADAIVVGQFVGKENERKAETPIIVLETLKGRIPNYTKVFVQLRATALTSTPKEHSRWIFFLQKPYKTEQNLEYRKIIGEQQQAAGAVLSDDYKGILPATLENVADVKGLIAKKSTERER